MKYFLLLLVSLVIALPANSQDVEIDSITAEIRNNPLEDTLKVNRLNTLARTVGVPLDIKLDAANKALIISRTLHYAEGEGYALANLGYIRALKSEKSEANIFLQQADSIAKRTNNQNLISYILARKALNERSADNKKALNYGLEAEEIALKTGNKQGQYDAQAIIGNIYQNMLSDFPNALKYRLKAVATAEETGSLRNRATSLATLATFYISIGDQENSILFYDKAIAANNKLGNKAFTRALLSNIGTRYALDGNYAEAIKNFKLSLEGETNPGGILININNLADAYTNMDSIPIALIYAFRSLAMATELGDINSYSSINAVISRAYLKKNMVDSAIYYGEQGLAAAKESQTIGNIRDNNFALANAYAFKKDYQNAYINHVQYIFYRDSILNNEITNKTNVLQYNYNLAKKESHIAELNQQKRGQRIFLISALIVLGLIIITVIALMRSNKAKQKANKLLKKQKHEIQDQRDQTNKALIELKQTQSQLILAEKMASLGELTAGIAHEIQNPLNFVNNFSEVSNELMDEMKDELTIGNQQLAMEIAEDIKQNLVKINHHGKRADTIVKGMLAHSRKSDGEKEPTDLNALAEEYLKLSYHGLRGRDKSFNAEFNMDLDADIPKVNVVSQDIGRVLLNLINNAFYAVHEKAKSENSTYEPNISVLTKKVDHTIEIHVTDNGIGIPKTIQEKIFQPFFTTKPAGQGTGLGLSLSYDIVKAHGGEIQVDTTAGQGTTFIVRLPHI